MKDSLTMDSQKIQVDVNSTVLLWQMLMKKVRLIPMDLDLDLQIHVPKLND